MGTTPLLGTSAGAHLLCLSFPSWRIKVSPTEDAQTPDGPHRLVAPHPRVAKSGAWWLDEGGCSTHAPQKNWSRELHARAWDVFIKHPCWSSEGQETFQKVFSMEQKNAFVFPALLILSAAQGVGGMETALTLLLGRAPQNSLVHPQRDETVPGWGWGWQRDAGSALGSLPDISPWFNFSRCSRLQGMPSAHEAQISEQGGFQKGSAPGGTGLGAGSLAERAALAGTSIPPADELGKHSSPDTAGTPNPTKK